MNDDPKKEFQDAVADFAKKVTAWKHSMDPKALQMTASDKEALLTLAQALLDETHPHNSDLVRLRDGRVLFVQRLN